MPSGGIVGYFGYEYQFFATTLLLLNTHVSDVKPFLLSVETLFGEDAQLEHRSVKALNAKQQANNTVIQIQVKTKQQTQHWRPAEIRELLLKNDESVDSGKTVLDKLYSDQNSIFLFITNGSVAENLAGLLSEKIGTNQHKYGEKELKDIRRAIINSDKTGKYEKVLTKKLTKNVLARCFIVANLSFEDIERQIHELLIWNYGIPNYQVFEKTDSLARIIRECARRKDGKSSLENSDVTEIVGTSGVKIPSQEVELLYLRTDEYELARKILDQNHMVLISGEPGFGKTTLAYKLANEQVNQYYRFELIGGEDSHLNILRACQGTDNIVFLLDDALGYDEYRENLGSALGNNFEKIVLQLQEASGRIKVLITSRRDLIAQMSSNTKSTFAALNKFLVQLPFSSPAFYLSVLKAHLVYLRVRPDITEAITSVPLVSEKFENLHHVRTFAYSLINLEEVHLPEVFLKLIEETKPTLYIKWIEKQPTYNQLFLISLWLISEVNQFAWEKDVKIMFDVLSKCISLPSAVGFSSSYNTAARNLQEKDRISPRKGNIIDFIHPTLKRASSNFLENIEGKNDFVACATKLLAELDSPLTQSIAVYLTTHYLTGVNQFETLVLASKSKYIQVVDTVIRFGRPLLESDNSKTKQLVGNIFKAKFHPSECEVNENGYLIRPIYDDDNKFIVHTGADLAEMYEWENIGFIPEKEPELTSKFQENLKSRSFMLLNPLERYKFLDWIFGLYRNRQLEYDDLAFHVSFMSADPISFVRQRVAEHLGDLLDAPLVSSVIESLSYDSSPHVRIAILEKVLLKYWVKQDASTQSAWMGMAMSMLSDSVVRLHCARGLIDQSGTLYFYHQEHTEEQKREWFKAVALKLLEHDFERDDFDRFLAAVDKHFPHIQEEYRLNLLGAIYKYIEKNIYSSVSITFTVNNIILNCNPSVKELDILLKLINRVPPIAKADFCFQLALNYDKLPDKRFQSFVHRPFFIEDPTEFILERTAGLLGFLVNIKSVDNLPPPIKAMAGDYQQALNEYIEKQSEDFKLIAIFQAFGYENSYHVSARYYSLYSHPVIKRLLREFVVDKAENPNTKFVVKILLNDNYYRTNAISGGQAEWLEFVELLLSSENVDLLKSVCDFLFQGNLDSSVHNTDDWLVLLTRLLTHQNSEIRLYTAMLYDRYFFDIWPDLSRTLYIEDESPDKYVSTVWNDDNFFQQLLKNCPSFREYLETMFYLIEVRKSWLTISSREKSNHISRILEIVSVEKYYINSLVEGFVEKLGDKLSAKDRSKLSTSITALEGMYNRRVVLGRTKHLESAKILRSQLPRFDWSKYID